VPFSDLVQWTSDDVASLTAVVDYNKLQSYGPTAEVLDLEPLADKWRSFGWDAATIDGHDFDQILGALGRVGNSNGRPLAIIANTVKGKGISFMEGRSEWHNRMPGEDQLAEACAELGLAGEAARA